jgi:hypothetical protein
MAVSNGQIANAATFNGAFVSRTVDSDTLGKVDLLNSASDPIIDVQSVINDTLVRVDTAEQDIISLENTRVFKATSSTDNAVVRFDGVTGQVVQNSGVTIDDTNNVNVPGDLTITGNLTVHGTTTTVDSTSLVVTDQNVTINNGGSDITADGAGLTVDRVGTDGSLIYDSAATSKWKIGNVGSEVEIATISGAQVITNKDIDGATATNTNRITVPKGTLSALTALTRKAGTIVYATDTLKFYYDNGTSLIESSGGAGSSIDVSTGTADAGKIIKTNSEGFLDKSFNNTVPSFASEAAFVTFVGRSEVVGDRFFDTGVSKLKVYSGTAWIIVGAGTGSGQVNFITNGDAETDTVGWATYADAAGTRPVDGTGGSPTVTFTRSTSSPLIGTASFLFTKDAANRQGQGASYAFTIDSAYKSKAIQISADYIVSSGTFVAGTSTTDSDVIVYLYDVTNATLIEPSSFKLLSNNTSLSDKFQATFQSASNSTSYRLILHCATTSASAYVLKFDNIVVGPSNYVYGTPITDVSTVTVPASSWTTNTTTTAKMRRVGDHAEIEWTLTLAGAPNNTSLLVNLPTGLTIDTTKMTGSTTSGFFVNGKASANRGATAVNLIPIWSTTTQVNIVYLSSITTGGVTQLSSTAPVTWASGDAVVCKIMVPIIGWSSSVQTSDQTDTRVVDFASSLSGTAQALTANTTNISAVATKDSHSAWTGSTYVVPVAGDYVVSAYLYSAASTFAAVVYLNGTSKKYLLNASTANVGGSGSAIIESLKVGDVLSIRSSTSITVASDALQHISISRISGPSAIAATESVNIRYISTAATSIANTGDTLVPFATRDFDSHGSWVTDTFTAPSAGKYRVSANIIFGSSTYAAGNTVFLGLYKNGSFHSSGPVVTIQTAGSLSASAWFSGSVSCISGDTLTLRAANSRTAGATAISTATGNNHVAIERIGS